MSENKKRYLVWFRQDLRISDNPALVEAIEKSDEVLAIYIQDENSENCRKMGGASKWFLNKCLVQLSKNLKEKYKISLILKEGKAEDILKEIVEENKINYLLWNRLYEPYYTDRDKKIKEYFENKIEEVKSFNGSLLVEPWEVKNGDGGFYKVYTPFYKKAKSEFTPREVLKEKQPQDKSLNPKSEGLPLEDLKLLPTKPNWSTGFDEYFEISEEAAQEKLYEFLENASTNYADERNDADKKGTSQLSPYLHFGVISPHQILSASNVYSENNSSSKNGVEKFISEIYWREFSYNLLFNAPIHEKNFRPEFDNFKWDDNEVNLKKWQKGLTGYPIVDAGMRELWATGWMHNRVRMVVASFLTKHLLIHWKHGEDWFWDTLVDADLANNAASWQWVSGSGADASPYFRIFNPITQGKKFDKSGEYTKKWCPELKNLPQEFLHCPWDAPELVLKAADVRLGDNYPKPLVEHSEAREKALKIYEDIKKK